MILENWNLEDFELGCDFERVLIGCFELSWELERVDFKEILSLTCEKSLGFLRNRRYLEK